MRTETHANEHALFLFPHQDDEYAASPWIMQELASGARVSCLYLTDGASNVPAAIRDAESLSVLTSLGVNAHDIHILADGNRIEDGKLPDEAERGFSLVSTWCATNIPPSRMYAPAWEGGHQDHDAAHVIALLIALEHDVLASSWQFSLYNGYRTAPHPLFRVFSQLPSSSPRRTLNHSFTEGWFHANLCWRYPSQRRTWIGLFPEAFLRRALLRGESLVACEPARVFEKPHPGTLLYERLFGVRYEDVRHKLSPLLERIREAGAKIT